MKLPSLFSGAVAGLLAVCLIGASASAGAPDAQPIYRLVWNIAPQNPMAEAREIAPGGAVARLKLTPPALFSAPRDIVDEKGEVLVAAGMQLVGLKSDAVIACTIHSVPKPGGQALLFLGALKRVCLIDADRDGAFETRFLRATNAPAFFLLRGRLSDRQQPILPIRLTRLDPEDIYRGPRIVIMLSKSSRTDKTIVLDTDVGNDDRPFSLSAKVRVSGALLPTVVDLYGARIEVSKGPAGTITVRALTPFQAEALDFWD